MNPKHCEVPIEAILTNLDDGSTVSRADVARSVAQPRQLVESSGLTTKTARAEDSSAEGHDKRFLKLHVYCGSDMLTETCTSYIYRMYCTSAGLVNKAIRPMLYDCEDHCRCYDEKGNHYVPPWIPFSPWAPLTGEVDSDGAAPSNKSTETRDESDLAAKKSRDEIERKSV